MKSMREYARRLTIALFNIDEVILTNEEKISMKESELCLMYALDDGMPHSQKQISKEWLVPKTTLNTIVKQWERQGLLTLSTIPGKRRELQISLTQSGKEHTQKSLKFLYCAEEKAIAKTLERYSEVFIEAVEYYCAALKEEFENSDIQKE